MNEEECKCELLQELENAIYQGGPTHNSLPVISYQAKELYERVNRIEREVATIKASDRGVHVKVFYALLFLCTLTLIRLYMNWDYIRNVLGL